MHVVMLSDFETRGGAAVAASRLANALVGLGIRVTRVVGTPDGNMHTWTTVARPTRRWASLSMKVLRRMGSEHVSQQWLGSSTSEWLDGVLTGLAPDIINVHNLHGASWLGWSPRLLEICLGHAVTVWTLHDMWSFTGRCAYSYDCCKFITGCDAACPTPREYPALNPKLIAGAWESRYRLFGEHVNLVGICPSRWLAQQAVAGMWKGHRVEIIPNGLPLELFLPSDRDRCRAELGIKFNGPVVLVVAQFLTERRKGGAILVEALRRIANIPLTVITLGHGELSMEMKGIKLHPLGYTDENRVKVLAYNAADLLVHAAPVDNLPNVITEALACGTPCVGFSVGGVQEMIRHGVTGWVAPKVTAQSLANAIDDALRAIKQGIDLRLSCRKIAEKDYDVRIQAQRYIELFGFLQEDYCSRDNRRRGSHGDRAFSDGSGMWN